MLRTISLQKIAVIIAFALVSVNLAAGQSPTQEKLLNGLKVLMWSDPSAAKVNLKLRIHSGSAFDPQGKEGAIQLLADSLFPDAATKEFFAEDLGGSLNVVTTYDYIEVDASAKPDSLSTMIETIANAVSNPAIDKDSTAKVRTALQARLKQLEADPAYVADQAAAKRLFGTYPYGRPQMGSTASVEKLTFADVLDQKERFLAADNATMTLSGNFDKASTMRAIRRYFGPWLKADKKVPATFAQPGAPDSKPVEIEFASVQHPISRLLRNAPGRASRNYYPMVLLSQIKKDQRCPDAGIYQAFLLRGLYYESPDTSMPATGGPCPRMTKSNDAGIDGNELDIQKNALISKLGAARDTLWLDVDTYGLGSVDDEIRRAQAVTIGDINALAVAMSAEPVASIVIVPAKPK